MKRSIFIIILAILLTINITAAQDAETTCTIAEGDPIRLGAVFPESTIFSVNIGDHFQGANAMLEAVNACGGVDGRPVEFIYVPAADRMEAEAAVRTLIDEEGVQLIVGSGVPAVNEGLTELAEAEAFVLWEVTQALTTEGEWTFSPRANNRQLGAFTADFIQNGLAETLSGEQPRVALVHEGGLRGLRTAAGVRDLLESQIIIDHDYGTSDLMNRYDLAEDIRDMNANVVVFAGYDGDADRLWYAARQEDANVKAWINIGSEGFRRNLCQRVGNNEAIITVTASGAVSRDYIDGINADLYSEFRRAYARLYNEELTSRAILSASGMYLLLEYVLPDVDGEYTAENIRDSIIETDVPVESGFMGEGLSMSPAGVNASATAVVQQRQNGAFCSVWPDALATCFQAAQPMPTWRERAIMEETMVCADGI